MSTELEEPSHSSSHKRHVTFEDPVTTASELSDDDDYVPSNEDFDCAIKPKKFDGSVSEPATADAKNSGAEFSRKRKRKRRGTNADLPNACPHCQMRFLYPTLLKSHIHNKHSKKHVCSKCNAAFDLFIDLRKHWATVHAKIFKCEKCIYQCRRKIDLARHVRKQHELGIECPVPGCTATMSSFRVGGHLKRMHAALADCKLLSQIKDPKYSCPECSFCTQDVEEYDRHFEGEHGAGILCPVDNCNTRMKLSQLRSHFEKFHDEVRPEDRCSSDDDAKSDSVIAHPCSAPGSIAKYVAEEQDLGSDNDEISKVTAVKPIEFVKNLTGFCCDICRKSYANSDSLRKHVRRIHQQSYAKDRRDKKYACTAEGCTKVFLTPGALSDHQNKHNNIFPHECPKCHRAFSGREMLAKHLKKLHFSSIKDVDKVRKFLSFSKTGLDQHTGEQNA